MIWALLPLAAAQDHLPGAVMDDAITVNVTRDGLDQLGGVVGQFLPTDPIALDPIQIEESLGFCFLGFEVSVDNMLIDLDIVNVEVIPGTGVLDILLEASVAINDPANPFVLDVEVACIGGDCNGHVAPFPVSVAVPVGLAIMPGPTGANTLDATIGDVVLTNGLDGSNIELNDCVAGDILGFLDDIGLSLYDLIIDAADDFLIDEVQNQVGEIETTIEDAFSAATISETIEILEGVELQIDLQPSGLEITPDGLGLALEGSVHADAHECVLFIDPNGSPATAGLPTPVGAEPVGTHVGLHVTDDFVNSALYAVWRSGILCQDLTGEVGGFSLDTNLLGLLGGDGFRDLFPETKPIAIRTVPLVPLEAEFGGANAIDVPVRDVDIRIYSELEGRQSRVLSVAISPDLGVGLNFDGTTGNLGADIALGDDYRPRLTGDMLVPGGEEDVLNTFGGVLGGIIDGVVGDLLADAVSFDIPSLDGFGLTSLTVTGVPNEGIDAIATVGTVPYSGAGCDGSGGCDSGCGGGGGAGCSSTGGASWLFLAVTTLLIRRRRG